MSEGFRFFVQSICALVVSAILLSIPVLFAFSIMFNLVLVVKIILGMLILTEIIAMYLAILLIFEETV